MLVIESARADRPAATDAGLFIAYKAGHRLAGAARSSPGASFCDEEDHRHRRNHQADRYPVHSDTPEKR